MIRWVADQVSRRRLLRGGAGLVASAVVGGGVTYAVLARRPGQAAPPTSGDSLLRFASRPDLALPPVTVTTPAQASAGLLFLTPAAGLG